MERESPGRAPGAICIELVLLSVTAGRHLPQPAGYARASPQSSASPALGSRRQPPARGLLKEPAALPGRAPAPEERRERLGASGPRGPEAAPRRTPASPRGRGCEPAPQGLGLPAAVTDYRVRYSVWILGFSLYTPANNWTFIIFIQAFFQDKKKSDFY